MIKKVICLILVIVCSSLLFSCKKDSDVDSTDKLYVLNGELYSKEKNGMVLTGGVNFTDLGINRKKIIAYGFVYAYYTPSEITPLYIGNDDMMTIETDDLDKYNQINLVIDVAEEYYNVDISFRMYIRYTDSKNKEQVLYSSIYNGANLYELALKNNSEYAKQIVDSVNNK